MFTICRVGTFSEHIGQYFLVCDDEMGEILGGVGVPEPFSGSGRPRGGISGPLNFLAG